VNKGGQPESRAVEWAAKFFIAIYALGIVGGIALLVIRGLQDS
jgi:hypothetical protein